MQVLLFNYSIENFDHKQTMGKDIFSMPDLCTQVKDKVEKRLTKSLKESNHLGCNRMGTSRE